ncbi:ribbon-helix-helix protein, CopG family [Campylobacter hyointestinalis]|nr:ribbon-helix-helix protein, CopG family [Campylobacter hyointestinalis]QKF55652.1 toxin-antitoxin system, antitoxin component [Campylobacter hyointestinalis subsp. hyointestinalis]TXK48513.1 ribbon-helix-helix protein, CopG family [Campylobacter hyointestinalis]
MVETIEAPNLFLVINQSVIKSMFDWLREKDLNLRPSGYEFFRRNNFALSFDLLYLYYKKYKGFKMTISVRLDDDLFNSVDMLSKSTNRSKSFYIKEALKEYLSTFDNSKYELNDDTLKSINNIEKGVNLSKKFNSVDDLIKDLNS